MYSVRKGFQADRGASQSWECEGSKDSFGVNKRQLQLVSYTYTKLTNLSCHRAYVIMPVQQASRFANEEKHCLGPQSHLAAELRPRVITREVPFPRGHLSSKVGQARREGG